MNAHGSILVFTLAVMILLVSLVGGFLYAASVFISNSGWEETDAKVLWLAEAGLQKAIWDLKTPAGSGGQEESWTTAGTTENLGDGSYTMVVSRYDFALASNGATASNSPAQTSSAIGPAKAIDGDGSTYWESKNEPKVSDPQDLIVAFPYPLTLNKVRFLSPSSATRPRDYTWAVSSDGSSYTTVLTVTSNSNVDSDTDGPDVFSAQSNVKYLRLRTTQDGQNNPKVVRVSTLEAIGSKITSTGTMTVSGNTYTRTVSETVIADDGLSGSPENQKAYYEPDWIEQ